jgi:hypothetical protein
MVAPEIAVFIADNYKEKAKTVIKAERNSALIVKRIGYAVILYAPKSKDGKTFQSRILNEDNTPLINITVDRIASQRIRTISKPEGSPVRVLRLSGVNDAFTYQGGAFAVTFDNMENLPPDEISVSCRDVNITGMFSYDDSAKTLTLLPERQGEFAALFDEGWLQLSLRIGGLYNIALILAVSSSDIYAAAVGEAAQRRVFFESQMKVAYKALGEVEDELQRYQEKSGVVVMKPQFEELFKSIAVLRAQIASKEVEISSLRTYARGDNPSLRRARNELAALRNELAKLEQQEQKSVKGGADKPTSLREAPQLSLEYNRRLRDVQYATAMYELMLKQFEIAKIDESRETVIVQVIDPATPQDYKFKPKRALIVIFATLLGLCLGMLWALWSDYIETMKKDPEESEKYEQIKALLSFRIRR